MFEFHIDKSEQVFYTDNQGKQRQTKRPISNHTNGAGTPLINDRSSEF